MDQLTFDEIGKQIRSPGLVVDSLDERVFDAHATPGPSGVLPRRAEHLPHRPASVHRNEGVAQAVVWRVQGKGKGHRKSLARKLPHPRHQPDRRDGDTAGAHAKPFRSGRNEPADGTDHR